MNVRCPGVGRLLCSVLVSLLVPLMLGVGCDGGTAGEADAAATPDTSDTVYTDWVAGATTTKKPAFGSSCRLRVESHRELGSSGDLDDRLVVLGADGGGARLEVKAVHEGRNVLLGAVDLNMVRAAESFGGATGTATWTGDGPFGGLVVDGTLCFEDALVAGQAVRGEFSLVVDVSGAYHSLGGDFTLDGATVQKLDPLTVRADPVALDLR